MPHRTVLDGRASVLGRALLQCILVGVVFCLVGLRPAQADSYVYDFSGLVGGSPMSQITGTMTFDTSLLSAYETCVNGQGAQCSTSSAPISSFSFTWAEPNGTQVGYDVLTVGTVPQVGSNPGSCFFVPGNTDSHGNPEGPCNYYDIMLSSSTNPSLDMTLVIGGGVYFGDPLLHVDSGESYAPGGYPILSGNFTMVDTAPEPAAWMMFISGALALAFFAFRSRHPSTSRG